MAENSKIEWTDHTFNPWMGCTKVSPGCQHCYAETMMDKRYGKVKWGPQGTRVRTSEAMWKKPLQWDNDVWYECKDCGWRGSHRLTLAHAEWAREICPNCRSFNTEFTHQRVFCASLADVFEDRPDVFLWRDDLFRLIEQTPNLDWLILTKRPENIKRTMPENVWLGVSVESQKEANERIPLLQIIPVRIKFLSCEPLLGHINLSEALEPDEEAWDEVNAEWDDQNEPEEFVEECEAELDWVNYGNDLVYNPEHREWVNNRRARAGFKTLKHGTIDWVICGGESGPGARPMNPMWAQELRNECQAAEIPFFFKQWGEWITSLEKSDRINGHLIPPSSKYCIEWGKDWFPVKIGKKAAGRLLDGREWNEWPRLLR